MSGRGRYLWRVGVAALLAAGVQPGLWAQIDAVFANSGQQNRVCLGDGNGDSSCSDVSADTNATSGVALGFVDGDDHLDAVFANSGWPDPQPHRLCLGDGNGGYSCSDLSGEIYYGTSDVALGLVDDDRNLDAVFSVYDFSPPDLKDDPLGGYILCLGDGNGGFSCSYFGPACSSGLALGYVDGDRRLDAVFANSECCGFGGCSRGENVICLGNGNGDFSCSDVSGDTNSTSGVALGFVDGDTWLDAVFTNRNQPDRVCLGDGNGSFFCSDVSGDTNGTSGVALGFVDDDRNLDAVFANYLWDNLGGSNRVCLGDGSGGFACSDVSGDTNSTAGVALGFVDRDTRLDAVFANWSRSDPQPNRVCLGDGNGGFSCSDVSAEANRTSDVALGELRSIEIFVDGFESGDTAAWSTIVP